MNGGLFRKQCLVSVSFSETEASSVCIPAVLAARKYGGGEGEVVVFALRRDI